MTWIACLSLVALMADGPQSRPASAAEAATLRDGKVLLGQVVESDRRGPFAFLIRRDWAQANVPDKLAAWEKLEGPIIRRAEAQRRDRLLAWRRERQADPGGADRITPWIDAELARLGERTPRAKTPLLLVNISRAEVKAVARRSKAVNRMLRLGWTLNLPDPETMAMTSLTQALEDRGYAPNVETPVSVDALLPVHPETDNHWLARRAATELAGDGGGRFLRYQGMVMDEPAPGEAPPAGAALTSALSMIQGFLSETPPPDPLPAKLQELGSRGRVGAVVTRMEMAGDFASVGVETTLWVRLGGNRWVPAFVKSSTVRPDALAATAGAPLGDDPQVKAAFGAIEALGLGQVPAELKQRSLNMGAATRQALGNARKSLDAELASLAIPLDPPRERSAGAATGSTPGKE